MVEGVAKVEWRNLELVYQWTARYQIGLCGVPVTGLVPGVRIAAVDRLISSQDMVANSVACPSI
jgi:hypothetical protein